MHSLVLNTVGESVVGWDGLWLLVGGGLVRGLVRVRGRRCVGGWGGVGGGLRVGVGLVSHSGGHEGRSEDEELKKEEELFLLAISSIHQHFSNL